MVAPSVPEHLARLRFFVACTHTHEQLREAVDAVVAVLAEMAGSDSLRRAREAVSA